MSYNAKVLADSMSPTGDRLTTVSLTFPRLILSEVNTHCRISRNSASSRAIPTEKLIEQVRDNPFVPEVFYFRTKGMGQGQPLLDQGSARVQWLRARDKTLEAVGNLVRFDVAKSQVNRLLEPFMWHTVIVTGTEWDNWFALRCPPGDEVDIEFPSQPEFQTITILQRQAMRASTPIELDYGEWHMPLVDLQGGIDDPDPMYWPFVSAGRCARVSYLTQEITEPSEKSHDRAMGLLNAGHMSPFMHQGRPMKNTEWKFLDLRSNFEGFVQLRKLIPDEANKVGVLEGREKWDAVA